jgi:hypothetical protein
LEDRPHTRCETQRAKMKSSTSQSKFPWRRAVGRLFVVVLLGASHAYAAEEDNPAWFAARQLMDAQQPSGLFAFERDFLLGGARPGTEIGLGRLEYITRETAAAYGLSRYYLYDRHPDIARALKSFLGNIKELSLPISKAPGQSMLESVGIVSLPIGHDWIAATLQRLNLLYHPTGEGRLVSYDRSYETAWGGATALSLLAELQYFRASRDPQFASLRQAWLQGLLVLYNGKGFRALPSSIDENALSNGEIWLALSYYSRLFPEDRVTAALVARLDDYMIETYSKRPKVIFYSWGTNAAAQRFETTSDGKFLRFIDQITRAYLGNTSQLPRPEENSCAAIEGLAAALRVLASEENTDRDFIVRLRQYIDKEMDKNRLLQIRKGQTRIELGNGAYLYAPSLADHAGAFLAAAREPYVRIDFTEHCISALLELDKVKR